jgi:hypothetical protein
MAGFVELDQGALEPGVNSPLPVADTTRIDLMTAGMKEQGQLFKVGENAARAIMRHKAD